MFVLVVALLLSAFPPDSGRSTVGSGTAGERAVRRYLTASDRESALRELAPEYRIWFEKREGEGLALANRPNMLKWDFALRRSMLIRSLRESTGDVVANVRETNDFTKLLDFPGWDARCEFTVNKDGLITSQLYVPAPNQPDWHPYLEKALPWLKANQAEALARIYPNGRLNQSPESAAEWVRVLTAWRAATRLPAIR